MLLREFWLFLCGCLLFCVDGANKTFVPTDSWQTIEDGVAVPAGLHVRMNLQTGKKEAKFLDDETKDNKKAALIKIEEERLKDEIHPDKIKELLKNIKAEDAEDAPSGKSFRSYDEIKKEFESLNMNIKTDMEIIHKLMEEFRVITNGSKPAEPGHLAAVLTDLEYLVHHYDNAVEFARLRGFTTIVIPCLNSTDNEVRAEALRLLGSAVQSNPKVQKAAVDEGCVTVLLKLLALERDSFVRSRGIYAISCLLRSFPAAQLKFVQDGGITVLSKIFDEPKDADEKTRIKIINLLTDLLVEVRNIRDVGNPKLKEQYELMALELNLREQGWCVRAADWFCEREDWSSRAVILNTEDLDHAMVDATVDLLLPLADSCLSDFVINIDLLSAVNHAKELYSDLALHELDDGVADSLYSEILRKLRALAVTFARTSLFKDEL